MRIGLVLPGTPAYSETFFRSKIKGLKANGIEVVLFADKSDPDFQLTSVFPAPKLPADFLKRIIRVMLGLIYLFIFAAKPSIRFYKLERQSDRTFKVALENLYLNMHILPQKLDWLHFGFATMALRRENVAQAIGARMAVSLRGYDISLYSIKHPGCYNLTFERVYKTHTISDALLNKAYALGLNRGKPIQKITPAVDIEQFNGNSTTKLIDCENLKLLTAARLKWVKGLEYTLEALALLKKQGIRFEYTIIGEGAEYERLAFAAYQLGLQEQVHFSGKLSHEAVKNSMAQADLYLQYSIQEGFCNAVLEAQAMGLLCIVSDAEGLPENVSHEQTGWVVPKRRPDLLAEQIHAVLELPPGVQQAMRESAINRVREEFNLAKQQQEFLSFYELNQAV